MYGKDRAKIFSFCNKMRDFIIQSKQLLVLLCKKHSPPFDSHIFSLLPQPPYVPDSFWLKINFQVTSPEFSCCLFSFSVFIHILNINLGNNHSNDFSCCGIVCKEAYDDNADICLGFYAGKILWSFKVLKMDLWFLLWKFKFKHFYSRNYLSFSVPWFDIKIS